MSHGFHLRLKSYSPCLPDALCLEKSAELQRAPICPAIPVNRTINMIKLCTMSQYFLGIILKTNFEISRGSCFILNLILIKVPINNLLRKFHVAVSVILFDNVITVITASVQLHKFYWFIFTVITYVFQLLSCRLCEETDVSKYDAHINATHTIECMKRLMVMYENCGSPGALKNRALFTALYLVYNLDRCEEALYFCLDRINLFRLVWEIYYRLELVRLIRDHSDFFEWWEWRFNRKCLTKN